MLGKLLKYDLKWVYKLIVIYYGLALVFALVGRGFSFLDNIFIFEYDSIFEDELQYIKEIIVSKSNTSYSRYVCALNYK